MSFCSVTLSFSSVFVIVQNFHYIFLFMPSHQLAASSRRKKGKTERGRLAASGKFMSFADTGRKVLDEISSSGLIPRKAKKWMKRAVRLLPVAQQLVERALDDKAPDEMPEGQLGAFGFLLPAVASAIGGLLSSSGTNTVLDEVDADALIADDGSGSDSDSSDVEQDKDYFAIVGQEDQVCPIMRRVPHCCVCKHEGALYLLDENGKRTSKTVYSS